jgi:hypothetical protein
MWDGSCWLRLDRQQRRIKIAAVSGIVAAHPSAIPLGFARGFGKTGQAFSKSARNGAPRLLLCQCLLLLRLLAGETSATRPRLREISVEVDHGSGSQT